MGKKYTTNEKSSRNRLPDLPVNRLQGWPTKLSLYRLQIGRDFRYAKLVLDKSSHWDEVSFTTNLARLCSSMRIL